MIYFLILAIYAATLVISIGLSFAYWQRNWPYHQMPRDNFYEDRTVAVMLSLCPILGFIVVYVFTNFGHYGWLWPWSAKAKREAGLIE